MNTYNIVVVGCGHMSNIWIEYAQTRNDCTIVALVDIDPTQAALIAQKKQLNCPIFTNVKEAILQTRANLVFDTSIPATHYEIASTAMQLGCDVLSEKPLAETIEQCQALVDTANKFKRTHAIMQNRRFDVNIRAARQLIEADTIGKPSFIAADFFLAPHFGGFRDIMDSPLLLDMAIHTFDQARLLSGSNPISVYCHEFNPDHSWYKGNAMAVCIFEMSDNSVFNYRGSWCSEGAPTSWEGSWRIVGEKGTIIWDGKSSPYAEVIDTNKETQFVNQFVRVQSNPEIQTLGFHQSCLTHMFNALQQGVKPETSSDDNIYSMAMVLAAIKSAQLGRKVYMDEIIK